MLPRAPATLMRARATSGRLYRLSSNGSWMCSRTTGRGSHSASSASACMQQEIYGSQSRMIHGLPDGSRCLSQMPLLTMCFGILLFQKHSVPFWEDQAWKPAHH